MRTEQLAGEEGMPLSTNLPVGQHHSPERGWTVVNMKTDSKAILSEPAR